MKNVLKFLIVSFVIGSSTLASAECFKVMARSPTLYGSISPTYFKIVGPDQAVLAEARISRNAIEPVSELFTNVQLEDKTVSAEVNLEPDTDYLINVNFSRFGGLKTTFRLDFDQIRVLEKPQNNIMVWAKRCDR